MTDTKVPLTLVYTTREGKELITDSLDILPELISTYSQGLVGSTKRFDGTLYRVTSSYPEGAEKYKLVCEPVDSKPKPQP